MLLPTEARPLFTHLASHRLVRVRRALAALDDTRGPVELATDDGFTLQLHADLPRSSILVAPGELLATPLLPHIVDVSASELLRFRLRRPVEAVYCWKSLDVSERAPELEFGLELVLQVVPGFAVEFLPESEDEPAGLVLSLGKDREPCRRILLAG